MLFASACGGTKALDLKKVEETVPSIQLKDQGLDFTQMSYNLQTMTSMVGGLDVFTAADGVYWLSDDNANTIFPEMERIFSNEYEEKLSLADDALAFDAHVMLPTDASRSEILILGTFEEGAEESAKTALDAALTAWENRFTGEAKELVANRVYEKVGNAHVYIACSDNATVLEYVKSCGAPVFGMMYEAMGEDIQNIYGVDPALVEEGLFLTPMMVVQASMVIVAKPVEGKTEELKTAIDAYMARYEEQWKTYLPEQYELVKNRLETEFDGHLVYIVSNDNEGVLNRIKNSYFTLFPTLFIPNATELKDFFEIDSTLFEESVFAMPQLITSSALFIVAKPAEGKDVEAKEALDAYMARHEQTWSTYLPAQYELVKNRLETTIGDYLVYIVSEDNDAVLKAIEACKK